MLHKLISILAFAAIISSCGQGATVNLPSNVKNHIKKAKNNTSEGLKRSFIVECPLEVSRYEGDSEIDEYIKDGVIIRDVYNFSGPTEFREYVNDDGVLVRETVHAGQAQYEMQVIGLCPNQDHTNVGFEFKTDILKSLSAAYSGFTVTDDQDYITTDLSHYVSLNSESNNFYVTAQKANEMWSRLAKGNYEFSANVISEDYEIAELYSFQFQIK